MSRQIRASELFVALSDEQQALVTGGQGTGGVGQGMGQGNTNFELSNTNFAQAIALLQGTTASGPQGSQSNSFGGVSILTTAAQDLLGLGSANIPGNVGGLGSAPALY